MTTQFKPKVEALSEKTVIPISLVIVLIPVIVWLVRLEGRIDANAGMMTRQDQTQVLTTSALMSIDRRLSRIEGKLDIESK